ncbi:MAG: choice-of-anchor J domain-containing protein, partial [Bacteroidales bacterium]|nr:choice-of-anchor J domain-containing protein [Bacteroidales bacterium]
MKRKVQIARVMVQRFLTIVVLFVGTLSMMSAQNFIDINAAGERGLHSEESSNPAVKEMFKDVDRYRTFNYNKQLASLRHDNVGDMLLLDFFDDKQYVAEIQRISVNGEGETIITAKIVDAEFAYCFIVVSESVITIAAELPFEDAYFFASVKYGQAFLGQKRKSEMDKDVIESTEHLIPPVEPKVEVGDGSGSARQDFEESGTRDINDLYTVDLLFVYTPAAEQWALNNSGQTDINHLITLAVEKGNLAMLNSGTGITFNVVHKHKTNYVETNTGVDFSRFTDPSDGYMDEVHDLRNAFHADVMVFVAEISYTGGAGWLLTNLNGFSNDTYASSINRVQQASWTYTVVHEIGHNMGAHHHAGQNTQPGPNTDLPSPLNNCSAGWKGTVSGTKSCTIMTYESASEYGETGNYTRIPYFSTPLITQGGVVIGNSSTMDNTRVLKETKTATAGYRTPPTTPTLTVSHTTLSFSGMTAPATKTVAVSGFNLSSGNVTYALGGVNAATFTVTPHTSWDPAKGGILYVTFNGLSAQNYNATLTISGAGASNKIVDLVHFACATTFLPIQEDFEITVFPPDCWLSESPTSSPWTRVTSGTAPSTVTPPSGSGMVLFNAFSTTYPLRGLLITPKLATNNKKSTVSFWIYRDNMNVAAEDRVNIYFSETPSITGLSPLFTVHRYHWDSPRENTNNTWYQYTVNLPTDLINEGYVIFEAEKGKNATGYYIYVDDIQIIEDPCEGIVALPVVESFDELPFPPVCWTSESATYTPWRRVTSGTQPACSPHTGSGMVEFNNYGFPSGAKGLLISPQIATNYQNSDLSFWMFRDYYGTVYNHKVNIYINTTPSLSGATFVATINGARQLAPEPVGIYHDWWKCTMKLPTALMANAYVIFEGEEAGSHINLYLDDIKIFIPILTVIPSALNFDNVVVGTTAEDRPVEVSGTDLAENITYAKTGTDAAAFTIDATSWNPITGGVLGVSFTPTEERTYTATLTISSAGAENKTVTLTGTGISLYTTTFVTGVAGECAVTELTETTGGGGIELPDVTLSEECDFDGYIFAGWATEPLNSETTTPPTLFAAGTTYYPSYSGTLYAVYGKASVAEPYLFKQVTTLSDFDYNARYAIVAQHFPSLLTYALDESVAVNTGYLSAYSITVSGSNNNFSLTYNENIPVWKFSGSSSGFTISNDVKTLYANSTSSMNAVLNGGNSSIFTLSNATSSDIAGTDNSNLSNRFVFNINNGMGMIYLNYNTGSNPVARFRNYSSAPSVAMVRSVYIFKKAENFLYHSNPDCSPLPVATPEFTPPADVYYTAQNVTITSTTEDAVIYYTTNGTTPTTASTLYSAPVSVTENTVIKAIAVKTGMSDSEVATATYTILSVPNVIISGVYGGGGNANSTYKNDYIELFNNTEEPIDLAGYTLYYVAAASANSSGYFTFPAGATINSKCFVLVQGNSTNPVGDDLPTPDFQCNIDLAAGAGKVLLLSAYQNLAATNSIPNTLAGIQTMANYVDYVPYGGTAVPPFGTQITPNLSATIAAKRKYNDATEVMQYTFNVGADFDRVTPAPPNSIPCTPIQSLCGTGTGTATDPYIICTAEELDNVRNNLSAHYKLNNDIDLTEYLEADGDGYAKWGVAGWLPIGTSTTGNQFTGSFDGDGKVVSNLTINRTGTAGNYNGLFGYTNGATIKNLGVENCNITANAQVGGLVGYAVGSTITNCYTTGT